METQLLRDSNIFPTDDVLKEALGNAYETFESFMKTITNEEYGLSYVWNFYKDGKSWLCKVSHKKKTVLWLSVWDGYFKTSFFFTEKYTERIAALNIADEIKANFFRTKSIGKLLPMLFDIREKDQLTDLLKVVEFKKNLK
jgi:hypothetical protein